MQRGKQTKTANIKLLLQRGFSDVEQIAQVVGSTARLVRHVRAHARAPERGRRLDTIERNIERLNQDVRDMRRMLLKLASGNKTVQRGARGWHVESRQAARVAS